MPVFLEYSLDNNSFQVPIKTLNDDLYNDDIQEGSSFDIYYNALTNSFYVDTISKNADESGGGGSDDTINGWFNIVPYANDTNNRNFNYRGFGDNLIAADPSHPFNIFANDGTGLHTDTNNIPPPGLPAYCGAVKTSAPSHLLANQRDYDL
jgi:hypothetical protein